MLAITEIKSHLPWRRHNGGFLLTALIFFVIFSVMASVTFVAESVLNGQRVSAATCSPTTNFITTWKTDNPGTSDSTSITIPGKPSGGNYYQVDWNNDGVMDELVSQNTITHDFGSPGTYTIQICGTFPQIYFNGMGDKDKILRVDQWGDNPWELMSFQGASNLDVTATDTPNLSAMTSMTSMFRGATSLVGNSSFNNWDTSNITSMADVFRDAVSFNQPIGNWDTHNVGTMNTMFYGATSFNQPIEDWDTSSVTSMFGLFYGASSFNQPLGNWDVSNVTDMSAMFFAATSFNRNINNWNVSSVTNMNAVFSGATSFNQPLANWNTGNVDNMASMFAGASVFNQPIGNWDTGNVTNMTGMFSGATYEVVDISVPSLNLVNVPMAFNQDISAWDTSNVTAMTAMFAGDSEAIYYDLFTNYGYTVLEVDDPLDHPFSYSLASWNVSNVGEMTGMLSGSSLSPGAYDATLAAWSMQSLQPGLTLGADGLNYCESDVERQNIITNHSWTINDEGASCFYLPPSSTLNVVDAGSSNEVPDAYDSSSHTVRLSLGSIPLAEATFEYNNLIDWSNISGMTDETDFKSVIAGLNSAPGVVGTHTLYVPKASFHDGVIVCPGATSLAQVTDTCPGAVTLRMGDSSLSVVSFAGKNYWKITGLTGTGAMGAIFGVPGAPNAGIPPKFEGDSHLIAMVLTAGIIIIALSYSMKTRIDVDRG